MAVSLRSVAARSKILAMRSRAVGATYDNVVHMRIFVVGLDEDKLAQVAEANKAVFSAEGAPTSTLIGVAALAAPDLAVEIEFDVVL